jgi:hypothetical protein
MLVVERKGENWPLSAQRPVLTSRGPIARLLLGNPRTRTTFVELLIDGEEDRTLRAVLVGMLRETERGG